MIKVLISYDMQQGKEQECQEYLVNKLAPGLGRLGFRFSDVWFTIWGESPQILGGGEVPDIDRVHEIFDSNEWEKLLGEMTPLTDNFRLRVVHPRDGDSNMPIEPED